MLSKRTSFFPFYLILILTLSACGSVELNPVGQAPVHNPNFPTTSLGTPGNQAGGPNSEGFDPGSGGGHPSLGELGTADNDGGTTDQPSEPWKHKVQSNIPGDDEDEDANEEYEDEDEEEGEDEDDDDEEINFLALPQQAS